MSAHDRIDITLGEAPATDAFGLELVLDGETLLETVTATGPGVFRAHRRADDAPAPLLRAGHILGFLQRGPLLLPVLAPADGWVLAIAPDGARVGHGAPLFRLLRATGAIVP